LKEDFAKWKGEVRKGVKGREKVELGMIIAHYEIVHAQELRDIDEECAEDIADIVVEYVETDLGIESEEKEEDEDPYVKYARLHSEDSKNFLEDDPLLSVQDLANYKDMDPSEKYQYENQIGFYSDNEINASNDSAVQSADVIRDAAFLEEEFDAEHELATYNKMLSLEPQAMVELIPARLFDAILLGGARRRNRGRNKKNVRRRPVLRNAQNKNLITTPSKIVLLCYNDGITNRNSAGGAFFAFRYRLNSLWDPDPLLSTGGISGFAQWGNFYRRYCVMTVLLEVELVNNESFPVHFVFCTSDIDIATSISTRASAVDTGELPFATKPIIMAGNSGMNRHKFRRLLNLPVVSGNRSAYFNSLDYSALNNTNPAIILYGNFIFYADSFFTASGGISISSKMTFKSYWSQRQTPFG